MIAQSIVRLVDLTALIEIDQRPFHIGILDRWGAHEWRGVLSDGQRRRRARSRLRYEDNRRRGSHVVGVFVQRRERRRLRHGLQQSVARNIPQTAMTYRRGTGFCTRIGYQLDTIEDGGFENGFVSIGMIVVDFIDRPIDALIVIGMSRWHTGTFWAVLVFDVERRLVDDRFFLNRFVRIDRWDTTPVKNISWRVENNRCLSKRHGSVEEKSNR